MIPVRSLGRFKIRHAAPPTNALLDSKEIVSAGALVFVQKFDPINAVDTRLLHSNEI
jgi:hypothetical protein